MIERQFGFIAFHCDSCPETLDTDHDEFDPAWTEAREAGWRAFKQRDVWCHECPACAEEMEDDD